MKKIGLIICTGILAAVLSLYADTSAELELAGVVAESFSVEVADADMSAFGALTASAVDATKVGVLNIGSNASDDFKVTCTATDGVLSNANNPNVTIAYTLSLDTEAIENTEISFLNSTDKNITAANDNAAVISVVFDDETATILDDTKLLEFNLSLAENAAANKIAGSYKDTITCEIAGID